MTCMPELDLWIVLGTVAFIGGALTMGLLLWFGLYARPKKDDSWQ